MSLRTTRPLRRVTALAAATVLTFGVAACSDDSSDDSSTPDEGTSTADAGADETTDAAEATADGPLSADKTEDLTDGDTITVTLKELDTSNNYYLAIARTDGESSDTGAYAGSMRDWVRLVAEGEEGGTDTYDADGNAEVDFTVQAGNDDGSVDCTTDDCSLKLVTDHSSTPPFQDVAALPVTFAS